MDWQTDLYEIDGEPFCLINKVADQNRCAAIFANHIKP
ncbi:hypothetical protein AO385_1518 [Moraxella catarrhalis]|uniref:Uncharacterized protein n=1 Tax=Moraxella catarrhalis TaxID=480 RepID=A0A198UVL4_MORCA|nr:hypothetical protein AO383_1823 [Moraxella catarrhalis]OAU98018.1 hypothetical protein AO384_0265 [Moraxella catarrhalis]OAU98892.1 hypothetical protein AO385_1518 [Moraxella catarrhalis]OAV00357.1 hypothetical protein AO382_1507 [Moraxella catarrhalis]